MQGSEDLIIVHDALEYGECRLSLAIPKYGIFENINSLKELAEMPQWTAEKPLRVATGFTYVTKYSLSAINFVDSVDRLGILVILVKLGPKFMKDNGLEHVTFSTADGALEAAPAVRFF
ncbi:ATP phosphoribosyltransferase 2 chloroplastic [Bienertia sinuspersici]